jgi:hypothetical protein
MRACTRALRLLAAIATLLASAMPPVAAQPAARGAIVQDRIAIESGAPLPLPEGRWRVADQHEAPQRDHTLQSVVLVAEDPNAAIPAMVLRYTRQRVSWGRTSCEEASTTAFFVERHGTLSSQLVNKCSRSFGLRRYGDWARSMQGSEWWRQPLAALGASAPWAGEAMVYTEAWVRRWNGPGVWFGAFVRTGTAGLDAMKIRDAALAGREEAAHVALRRWTDAAVEAIGGAFLEDVRSARIPALAPALAGTATPTVSLAAAGAARPAAGTPSDDAVHERIRQMTDQGRQAGAERAPASRDDDLVHERIRQMTEQGKAGAPAQAQASAPARPPSAAASQASVAAAPPAAPAATPAVTPAPPSGATPAATPVGPSVDQLAIELARLREELRRQQAAASAAPPAVAQDAPRPPPAVAARRLALVIGNDAYSRVSPLQNARSDARAIAVHLGRLGYAVTLRTDLGERAIKDELRQFKSQVQGGDEVLFFFAGHGVQVAGANYLLPTDIRGDSEDQVRDDALPLQKVLDDIQERKARFTLAVVDACRDNPFRSAGRAIGTRGLAPTSAATGQMVMFSAGAGQQALDKLGPDDRDPNGLFTRVLLRKLDRPGVSIDRLMREVRTEVVTRARAVGHEQVPALYDQSIGEFYFRP